MVNFLNPLKPLQMTYQRCDTIQLILQKGQSSIQRINPNHRIVHRYFVVVGKVVGQQQVRVQLRRVERPRRRGTAFFFSDYFQFRPEVTDSLIRKLCLNIYEFFKEFRDYQDFLVFDYFWYLFYCFGLKYNLKK